MPPLALVTAKAGLMPGDLLQLMAAGAQRCAAPTGVYEMGQLPLCRGALGTANYL